MEEQRLPACSPVLRYPSSIAQTHPHRHGAAHSGLIFSPVNLQSRQSLTEMTKGLSNVGSSLNEATSSQVTGGSVLLITKINQLIYVAFCITALWLILITQ